MFAKLCAGAALATALLAATSASAGPTGLGGSPGDLLGSQDSQDEYGFNLVRSGPAIAAAIPLPPVILVPQEAAGAPEPDAWTLMIAGFGAVGAALRRRRIATPSAA